MSTLEEILTSECGGMTNEQALSHIKQKTITVDGLAEAGYVLAYLATINKLKSIRIIATDDNHELQDAADAIIITLEGRDGFDFRNESNIQLLAAFVSYNVITQSQSDHIRVIGQTVNPAFPNTRMVDIQNIRGEM